MTNISKDNNNETSFLHKCEEKLETSETIESQDTMENTLQKVEAFSKPKNYVDPPKTDPPSKKEDAPKEETRTSPPEEKLSMEDVISRTRKAHSILSYIISDSLSKELTQGYHFKLTECQSKKYKDIHQKLPQMGQFSAFSRLEDRILVSVDRKILHTLSYQLGGLKPTDTYHNEETLSLTEQFMGYQMTKLIKHFFNRHKWELKQTRSEQMLNRIHGFDDDETIINILYSGYNEGELMGTITITYPEHFFEGLL
ncbi:hypothetical protein DID77_01180 [Candidatus Marinamargulisbacteria bacterium SCGC AG-439-L15]|nr:hypothetical protein DID77_01180 [Candidatus Marinamargulisbacteria bacterium SCGC AG-439-L15]